MKTVSVQEAIKLARAEASLEGYAINDLEQRQVTAKDALLLARHGILIPEQNIRYGDEDVRYDPDFDDYEWTQLPAGISIEEQAELAENYRSKKRAVLIVEIEVEDDNALQWGEQNYVVLKTLFSDLFRGFYAAKSITDKRETLE